LVRDLPDRDARADPPAWRAYAVLVVLAGLLLLPGLGRMGARDSTDARYLEAAREMFASGDWWVPRLAGVPHLHKPPLSYWSGAAGFAALGVTPFAGRLGEQLALGATALLVLGFARRHLGPGAALAAAAVFLTSGLVFVSSRGLNTDLFQLFFLTGALSALYEGSKGRTAPTAGGFALLGASMWAKGPIALLVALAILVPFLVLRRGERRLPGAGLALGLLAFLAVGLPWYADLMLRDPSLLNWFLGRQLAARVAGGGEGHPHGPFYLPGHFVLGLLPWTPLVLLALARLRPRTDPLDLFLLLWSGVPLLLFELFPTKLPTYLLPAFPGAALAVGRALSLGRLADRRAGLALGASALLAGAAALALAGLCAWLAAGGSGPSWLDPAGLGGLGLFAAILAGLGGLGLHAAWRSARRPGERSLGRAALAVGAALVVGFGALAPGVPDEEAPGRAVRSVPGARVVEYGVFSPSLLFYSGDVDGFFVAVKGEQAAIAKRYPDEGRRLGLRRQDAAAMMAEATPTFLLVKRRHEDEFAGRFGAQPVVRSQRHSLLANAAAAAALERYSASSPER
jgi:4-amino-4-deoxy-L-arabinose transferase-like glycosyltransferase